MEGKRTYIRRKRCLNEIVETIKSTLQYISEQNNNCFDSKEIERIAKKHSSTIEAACWFPKQHMTEEEYSSLLMGKTKLLCQALMQSKVPKVQTKLPLPVTSSPSPEPIVRQKGVEINAVYPMTGKELSDFIKEGQFSFSSIEKTSIPPLINRGVNTTANLPYMY